MKKEERKKEEKKEVDRILEDIRSAISLYPEGKEEAIKLRAQVSFFVPRSLEHNSSPCAPFVCVSG